MENRIEEIVFGDYPSGENIEVPDKSKESEFICLQCFKPIMIDISLLSINDDVKTELLTPLIALTNSVDSLKSIENTEHSSSINDDVKTELLTPFIALTNSMDSLKSIENTEHSSSINDDVKTELLTPLIVLTNSVDSLNSIENTEHSSSISNEEKSTSSVNTSILLQEGKDLQSSFVNIPKPETSSSKTAISNKLRMDVELFDLLSDNAGEIDHPLCEECTDTILENMDQQLKLSEEEAQQYHSFLQKLEGESEDDGHQVQQLQKELSDLQLEEENHRKELKEIKDQLVIAEGDMSEQIKRREDLEKQENKYWKEYSKYKRDLLMAEDDFRSLDCQIRYAQNQMDRLRKTNVFSATFHIWHSGYFATINGFRLGRLSSITVEWSEINAALGQSALLLSCLSKTIGLGPFKKYQIVPYGSYSYIKVLVDDKVLPLYSAARFRIISDTKYDNAMVAFLDCLSQFAAEVQRLGAFALPYEIDPKGKIRDNNSGKWYSIKIQFNTDDNWTKACRYMLTNLKWGQAYVGMTYMTQHQDSFDPQMKGTLSS